MSPEKIISFLDRRRGLLDGVVLSGGEASVYPSLHGFIKKIRDLGYQIKLDTNGLRPDMLARYLDEALIDYVALDYKAPIDHFKKITGTNMYRSFSKSLDLLCSQTKIPVEIRTTVHTDLLNETDIQEIICDLEKRKYKGTYYIQNFCSDNDRPTLAKMPEQKRFLKPPLMSQPASFKIGFRNF